jgi:hypothetical protein
MARTIGRMQAIQNTKAMAGSQDADFACAPLDADVTSNSFPPSCAWLLYVGPVRLPRTHERK